MGELVLFRESCISALKAIIEKNYTPYNWQNDGREFLIT